MAGKQIKLAWRNWMTWDAWVLATFSDRINFIDYQDAAAQDRFIKKRLSSKEKDAEIEKHRDKILDAIKNNNSQGEHVHRQTYAYILGKICIGLITASAGFMIAATLLSFFPGLPFWASYLLAVVTFVATVYSDNIGFRKSVPRFWRLLVEYDKTLGHHFFASQERQLGVQVDAKGEVTVTPQYHYEEGVDQEGRPLFKGQSTPKPTDKLPLQWYAFLGVCFSLSIFVGMSLLAQMVEKAPIGMQTILSLPLKFGQPIAWVLGVAAFVVMLGQYTYSVVRFVRNPNRIKEFKEKFRKFDTPENIVHNILLGFVATALVGTVFFGMYGTSQVQADLFMKLMGDAENSTAKIAVLICTMGGKSLFTFRAAMNFFNIIPQAVGALGGWVKEKCHNGWYHLTGQGKPQDETHSVFDTQNSEDQINSFGYLAIAIHALAKSSTAIQQTDGGISAAFPTEKPLLFTESASKVAGTFSRVVNEGLDKQTRIKPPVTNNAPN
jgi:hypothetical protein